MTQLYGPELKRIGKMIRSKREQLGIASMLVLQQHLAKRGVLTTIATLSRIETGVQPVSLDWVQELAAIIDIPAHQLRPDIARKFKRECAA